MTQKTVLPWQTRADLVKELGAKGLHWDQEYCIDDHTWWWWRDFLRVQQGLAIAVRPDIFARMPRAILQKGEALFFFQSPWRVRKEGEIQESFSYVPSLDWGLSDRRIVTRPGRWFKKFMGDVLTDDMIENLASGFTMGHITWVEGGEAIAKAYQSFAEKGRGLASCMTYTGSHFHLVPEGRHPTEAYGEGWKLAVWSSRKGAVPEARALVYEPLKGYTRLYGPRVTSLGTLLNALGYKLLPSFAGAMLKYIPVSAPTERLTLLVPFVDGAARSGTLLTNEGEHTIQIGGAAPTIPFNQFGTVRKCAHCSGFGIGHEPHC